MREADAWRALLSLHGTAVHAAHQIARTSEEGEFTLPVRDEETMNSDSREAAYCAALTGLASQCDNLCAEAMRLRALRKARRTVEVQCYRDVVRRHADESLAVGQTMAANAALNIGAATAELRGAIATQRSQISGLRSLLSALGSAQSLPLPMGVQIVVGLSNGSATTLEQSQVRSIDELLKDVYAHERELNDTSLAEALRRLFVNTDTPTPTKQFARRSADRVHH